MRSTLRRAGSWLSVESTGFPQSLTAEALELTSTITIRCAVSIHRLFSDAIPNQAGLELRITGEEAHHAAKVKRIGAGQQVYVQNGAGTMALCEVLSSEKVRGLIEVLVRIISVQLIPQDVPETHVFCAAPKADRIAWLAEQLSQVGATCWTPLETEFSSQEGSELKLDRLRRIASESSKQCGRPWLMAINTPLTLAAALAATQANSMCALLVGDSDGELPDQALARAAPELSKISEIAIFIGPEGGFSSRETEQFAKLGAMRINLGRHILRIETAAVASVIAVRQEIACRGGR